CFEVYLPATPDVSVDGPSPASRSLPKANGELVLVADDEHAGRDVTRRVLEGHGHRVLLAVDGVDAVALYMRHRTEIRAVVTDMMMPGVDGASLVRILRQVDPQVPVIGMSGIGDPAQLAEIESLALPVLLQKPFPPERLLQALHETIHALVRTAVVEDGKEQPLAVEDQRGAD
nr:response regulator [Opitutaceae bacterium]